MLKKIADVMSRQHAEAELDHGLRIVLREWLDRFWPIDRDYPRDLDLLRVSRMAQVANASVGLTLGVLKNTRQRSEWTSRRSRQRLPSSLLTPLPSMLNRNGDGLLWGLSLSAQSHC
jgi:hypothetical protein